MNDAIVLVTTSFPIRGDGSEAAGSFVSDVAEEIARQGQPVRVVAPGPARARARWSDGVEVFRFAAPEQPLSTLKPWNPADLLAIRRVLRAGLHATREAVRAGATNHVLALWALPSGYWARRAALESDLPYSVWTLGSDIWTLGRIPLVRGYLQGVLRDAHTCYSDGVRLAEDTRRIGKREVEFLPSTRRIENLRTEPTRGAPPYRLLFLGRWHPNKGADLLLDALAQLDEQDWARIEMIEVCGGGPLEALVKEGVARLRAAGRPVELRGYLDKAGAEAAIARADYLLIPSRIESIPVVFSDAMKLGCPVVSMPTGDLPDLVAASPSCGVVAESISAEGFAAGLSRALALPATAFSAGTTARARQFDLAGVVGRLRANLDPRPTDVAGTPRWGNRARDRKALAIWLTLLQHCGPRIAEGAWLDVGCGSAGIAMTLATKARLVTGVDPEPWDAWADAMAEFPNLNLLVGNFDGESPPLADASINVVVCNQVYEHVEDPVALLRNIHRVLVRGGVCYFAGPNLLWPIEPHVFWPFVHWLPRQCAQALMRILHSGQADQLDAYSTHYWGLLAWFRSTGFVVESGLGSRIAAGLRLRGHERGARLASSLPHMLFRLAMPLSPGFVFVLRKPERATNATQG